VTPTSSPTVTPNTRRPGVTKEPPGTTSTGEAARLDHLGPRRQVSNTVLGRKQQGYEIEVLRGGGNVGSGWCASLALRHLLRGSSCRPTSCSGAGKGGDGARSGCPRRPVSHGGPAMPSGRRTTVTGDHTVRMQNVRRPGERLGRPVRLHVRSEQYGIAGPNVVAARRWTLSSRD